MENSKIKSRLSLLREKMSRLGIDYFLIPTADFHNSEYVAPYFQTRAYFCGFTGSNGTLVVGMEEAGLWTDGRYFIQAEKELQGTGVDLYREGEEGVPTAAQWLADRFGRVAKAQDNGEKSRALALGFDGRCVNVAQKRQFQKKLSAFGVRFVTDQARKPDVAVQSPRQGCGVYTGFALLWRHHDEGPGPLYSGECRDRPGAGLCGPDRPGAPPL